MLKWLDLRGRSGKGVGGGDSRVTDDPLATITHVGRGGESQTSVYAVSRINPIFVDDSASDFTMCITKPDPLKHPTPRRHRFGSSSPPSAGKSSGYGSRLQSHSGSSQSDPIYSHPVDETQKASSTTQNKQTPCKFREDAVKVLEQNSTYVKSIMVGTCEKNTGRNKKQIESFGSSAGGTLSTIPEGKVDVSVPRPVWPKFDVSIPVQHTSTSGRLNYDINEHQVDANLYDSIVDEALLFYTTMARKEDEGEKRDNKSVEPLSTASLLKDLSKTINEIIDGKIDQKPEELLKELNERITLSIEVLQEKTRDNDMKNLCHRLSTDEKVTTVARALSHSFSSSGNSSQQSVFGDWDPNRIHRLRTISSETEELYQVPSASSSSGFSDLSPSNKQLLGSRANADRAAPVFVHKDLSSVPNGVRNAMIYGTLCRGNSASVSVTNVTQVLSGDDKTSECAERKLLTHAYEDKPSTWQIYYGAGVAVGDVRLKAKPTDTPNFPAGGRPEADFTLDVPRAELLMRRMKADKRWRCRCRIFTSFLGLAFFLLSVMAVSLMLTRGKRMFGSIGAAGF